MKTVIETAIDRAKQEEGFCGKAYRCPAGKITIGYGHNCEDSTISKEAAEFILKEDIIRAEQNLWHLCPEYAGLDDVRKGVLLDMAFNMGWGALRQFVRMFEAIRRQDWTTAANEILDSDYGRKLVLRSDRNARMMRTGQYVD